MKRVKLGVLSLVAALVALCVVAVPALAEDGYGYKVRIFGGNHGTVNGESVYTLPQEYALGQEVKLDTSWVQLEDESKYYVKGFRVSGSDDPKGEYMVFNIQEDTDLVVVYAVRGEMVSYTVSFVEYGTGNPLVSDAGTSSVTFYGKKGDKPVVPYEYITGYRPRYLNVTGTLGDEGTNNWTLEYIPLETPEVTTTTTEETVVETVTNPTTTTTTTPAVTAATPTATETTTPTATTPTATTPTATTPTTPTTPTTQTTPTTTPPATEQILDVDNPLAGPSNGTPGNDTKPEGTDNGKTTEKIDGTSNPLGALTNPLVVGSTIGALVLALLLALFFMRRRNDGEQ